MNDFIVNLLNIEKMLEEISKKLNDFKENNDKEHREIMKNLKKLQGG